MIRRASVSNSQGSDKPQPPVWRLPQGYVALHQGFRWQVPRQFNIAQVCSQRWAQRPGSA